MKFRFTIGKKIGAGFGILIALTLIAFILTLVTLNKSRRINDEINDVVTPSVSALEEMNLILVESKMLITSWVFYQSNTDAPDKVALINLINVRYPELKKRINQLSVNWRGEEKQKALDLFNTVDSLFTFDKEIMETLTTFISYEDPSLLFMRQRVQEDDIEQFTKKASVQLLNLIEVEHTNASNKSGEMIQSFKVLQLVVQILGLFLLVGGVLTATFTVRTIVGPIHYLKDIILQMGRGVLPKDRIQNRNDEIGEMSVALNYLVDGMRSTTEFANEVGSGNFQSHYQPLSSEDSLGLALLKMREELEENERVLEAKVIERTEEVVRQKKEIESQNSKLDELLTKVTDSILYAKRIQEAILPPDDLVRRLLPNAFILFRPKDIVSGDFYWMDEKEGKILFAAVDCTGHGVPGAFMTIVGSNVLNQVVNNNLLTEPALILDGLNLGVTKTLRQGSSSSSKDGMDISFCCLDPKTNVLEWAGAFNSLYLVRNGDLQEIKANKFPIGYFVGGHKNFTNNTIQLQKGDAIYIFTDGYSDQFGGPNGKKFMAKNFRSLLLQIQHLTPEEQRKALNDNIDNWRGPHEQVDDVLVIGVQIK
jgi:serine phosphatase RsbU (regulator of sigma subunit)